MAGSAAGAGGLLVRVGLWLDAGGKVVRARYQATCCASLIAYAEVACELLESSQAPEDLDAGWLREHLAGVHPIHHDRAELVARAIGSARERRGPGP